jgi:hypothetical protein
MTREDVYQSLDSERTYQDKWWGGPMHDKNHSVADFILFMEHHIQKAKDILYDTNKGNVMDEVRKVTALGVACGEIHGMPKR